MNAATMLILGGTGKTGRRIVARLRALDVPVRVGSRNSETPFDWEDPATWRATLQGVSAVYISYYPDLAMPGAAAAIQALTLAASEAGVKRLVLLTGRGEPEAQRCERIVQASGLQWTILRASWFNQNFSEGYLIESLLAGEVALPAGPVGEPFVDAEDIADVAVAALLDERHHGQVYELTGPRPWTFAEAVAEIGRSTGRAIDYRAVSLAEHRAVLESMQVPEDLVALILYLFEEVLDGRNAHVSDGVQRALGRAPRDFTDYVRATAAAGIWQAPAREGATPPQR